MQFQHVDPQAAVDIHEDVKSNFSIGIHWGTFNLSYEVRNADQPVWSIAHEVSLSDNNYCLGCPVKSEDHFKFISLE